MITDIQNSKLEKKSNGMMAFHSFPSCPSLFKCNLKNKCKSKPEWLLNEQPSANLATYWNGNIDDHLPKSQKNARKSIPVRLFSEKSAGTCFPGGQGSAGMIPFHFEPCQRTILICIMWVFTNVKPEKTSTSSTNTIFGHPNSCQTTRAFTVN